MTDQVLEELREKDRIVLEYIEEGRDDTQKITEATTLETHEVRYSLQKLEQLGIVTLEKPEGMVERLVNGQKRVFQHPIQAELTGRVCLVSDENCPKEYRDPSRRRLADRVKNLETEVGELKEQLRIFRKQVERQIE